jgi:hypothetical protein
MKRSLAVGGMAVAMVVLLAPAAMAKGNGEVIIRGPGAGSGSDQGGGPIIFKGGPSQNGPGAFWEFAGETGVFQETKTPDRPFGALGPRYTMDVYISESERPNAKIDLKTTPHFRAYIYPYAQGGPWVYVPENTTAKEFGTISSGWWATSQYVLDRLWAKGLPKTSPVPFETIAPPAPDPAPAAQPAPAVQPAGSGLPKVWIGLAVGLVLMLMVVGGALLSRPKKVRVPA